MATLSAAQVNDILRRAGFSGKQLDIAAAIARAESGWRTDAKGDVDLQGNGWGPSLGLFQIRCRIDEIGTGKPRDCNRLTDPEFNARAALAISGKGTNWNPWTVYKTGAYREYLGMVTTTVSEWIPPLKLSNWQAAISSAFGVARNIVLADGRRHTDVHDGVDIAAKSGTPIYAPADGKVNRTFSDPDGALILEFATGNIVHGFAHLSRYAVTAGDSVKQGQIIGYTGATGRVTAPHLHWSVTVNGQKKNPMDLFDPLADIDARVYDNPGMSRAYQDQAPWDVAGDVVGNLGGFLFGGGLAQFLVNLFVLLGGIALTFIGGAMVWSAA
jgi:hypothetical protein